jgi:hypothetical protein
MSSWKSRWRSVGASWRSGVAPRRNAAARSRRLRSGNLFRANRRGQQERRISGDQCTAFDTASRTSVPSSLLGSAPATARASAGSRSSADARMTDPKTRQAGGDADQPVFATKLRDCLLHNNENNPGVTKDDQSAQIRGSSTAGETTSSRNRAGQFGKLRLSKNCKISL